MNEYKILMVTKSQILKRGLSYLFKEYLEKDVVLDIVDLFGLVKDKISLNTYDLLILEFTDLNNEEVRYLRSLPHDYPELKVMVLYETIDEIVFKRLFRSGVIGFLPMNASLLEIQSCLTNVCGGRKYIPSDFLDYLFTKLDLEKPLLTDKEKMIEKLLIEGKKNVQICELLKIHPSTVSTFKQRLLKKMQVKNLMELKNLKHLHG